MTDSGVDPAEGRPWFVLVESNTTGTGRDFAAAAAAQGMRPVLLARDPRRYPYVAELALPARVVDTADPAAVVAACHALGAPGLAGITSSSEYFVQTAARVATVLGLPAQDERAIGNCRDKATQRRLLRAARVTVPDFVACATAAEVERAAAELGGPVVVKPVYGSGSEGVRRCVNPGAARWWATRLLAVGRGRLLVEAEVPGPEFSVEIIDGEPVGVTRKHVGRPPYFVETGHDHPAELPPAAAAALTSVAMHAVRAIGHTAGPAHVELRAVPGGEPAIIEINPRLAGGLIPRLVHLATGRNLVAEVVAAAAGRPAARSLHTAGRFASIRFLLPSRAGMVAEVTGLAAARGVPGVVDAACVLAPGADIRFQNSFKDRVGHVIGTGATAAEAITATERAIAEIRLTYADELTGSAVT
jgi:biotin carboxylase